MIQLENVQIKLRSNQGFKRIDLQIQDQDVVILVLLTASQLLNVLSGLEKVDEGHILIQGRDLAQLADTNWQPLDVRRLAFILQQYYLLPNSTVRQNVKMGQICKQSWFFADYRGFGTWW